jgi:hypothetical protein
MEPGCRPSFPSLLRPTPSSELEVRVNEVVENMIDKCPRIRVLERAAKGRVKKFKTTSSMVLRERTQKRVFFTPFIPGDTGGDGNPFTDATELIGTSRSAAEQPWVGMPADLIRTEMKAALHALLRSGPYFSSKATEEDKALSLRELTRRVLYHVDSLNGLRPGLAPIKVKNAVKVQLKGNRKSLLLDFAAVQSMCNKLHIPDAPARALLECREDSSMFGATLAPGYLYLNRGEMPARRLLWGDGVQEDDVIEVGPDKSSDESFTDM